MTKEKIIRGEPVDEGPMNMGVEMSMLMTVMDILDTWPLGDEDCELAIAGAMSTLIRPLSKIPFIRAVL